MTGSFNRKVSAVGAALVVCVTLASGSVAWAQGAGAPKSLRSLGGPTRFTAPVRSVDALKRSMARRGIQRDIATVLTKAGNPSVAAEVKRILAEGQVRVSRKGRLLNILEAGECVGEMGFLGEFGAAAKDGSAHSLRSADVTTLVPCTLIRISPQMLGRASQGCQLAFNRAFLGLLAERLRMANQRISST